MIELAVLGTLKEGAMHGYELKKRLEDVLGRRSAVSFGSLYPALNRLERDGSVVAVAAGPAADAPSTPMTGSFDGEAAAFRASRRIVRGPRNKKVYGITEAGDVRLAELLSDPGDDERSFPVKVAFCRFADPATRLGLLERRRATLVERLGHGQRSRGVRSDRLDRYRRSVIEHEAESTERDIAWLDRLLTEERALPPASPSPTDGPATAPGAGAAELARRSTPAAAPATAAPVPQTHQRSAAATAAPVPAAPTYPSHEPPAAAPSAPAFPTHQPSRSDGDDTADTANGGSR